MKKIITGILTVFMASLFFIGGVYAANQGWLSFTGDNAVENSKSDVDEIMAILEEVHAGKVSAEEALAELEALNPKGLVKKIKVLEEENGKLVKENTDLAKKNTELAKENTDLRASSSNYVNTIAGLESRIAQLEEALANAPEDQSEYVAHLEAELHRANEKVEELSSKTKSAVEKARTYK